MLNYLKIYFNFLFCTVLVREKIGWQLDCMNQKALNYASISPPNSTLKNKY